MKQDRCVDSNRARATVATRFHVGIVGWSRTLLACRSAPGRRAKENQVSSPDAKTHDYVVIHPLDAADAGPMKGLYGMVKPMKGKARGVEARAPFDAVMERVQPFYDVAFETDTVGGISGLWVRPAGARSDAAILHLHGGWFNLGKIPAAYRHLVAQIAARAGVPRICPRTYRLAPEHPFPAAPEEFLAAIADSRGAAFDGSRSPATLPAGTSRSVSPRA